MYSRRIFQGRLVIREVRPAVCSTVFYIKLKFKITIVAQKVKSFLLEEFIHNIFTVFHNILRISVQQFLLWEVLPPSLIDYSLKGIRTHKIPILCLSIHIDPVVSGDLEPNCLLLTKRVQGSGSNHKFLPKIVVKKFKNKWDLIYNGCNFVKCWITKLATYSFRIRVNSWPQQ